MATTRGGGTQRLNAVQKMLLPLKVKKQSDAIGGGRPGPLYGAYSEYLDIPTYIRRGVSLSC